METDGPVPKWYKHMQYLPKDSMRRVRKQEEADAVQNTGRLQLPEQKINALCRTCRLKGTKLGRRRHRTHKGEHCRERRCTQCGVYRASSHFRRTKRGRVDICRTCELVPCAACAAMLPRRNFTDADIYRYFYFAGTKHITCLVCKEQQHARRQRLQNLMEKSDRAACWCKHPHAHTRKCPLHARYEGERPYPGCDVMSRADSDWLIEQRKKNRYGRGT